MLGSEVSTYPGVVMDLTYSGTTGVVAREDSLELRNTIVIGGLDTTKPGVVKVGSVVLITVARGNDTTVHTSGVAVPTSALVRVDVS